MAHTKEQSSGIFIFDSARTRSFLFFRYLSTNPDLAPIEHPYLAPRLQGQGQDRIFYHLKHSDARRKQLQMHVNTSSVESLEHYQKQLVRAVHEALDHGRIPTVNEHWFNNLTTEYLLTILRSKAGPAAITDEDFIIPDAILKSLRPVILTRHPLLTIDSNYRGALKFIEMRPGDEDFELITTFTGQRLLFDYFQSRGRTPIVVDGEDILWRTEDMTSAFCARLGIENKFRDSWEPCTEDDMAKMRPVLRSYVWDAYTSKGIQRPAVKPVEPTMDAFFEMWVQKYGSEVATVLKELVEKNMADYEYLIQFKV